MPAKKLQVFNSPQEIQKWSLAQRRRGKTIGFVPTMGALHEGHLSLMRRARAENHAVVSSIFVNPIQFGPKEDLDNYPNRLEADKRGLKKVGVDALFLPDASVMYPEGFQTKVVAGPLADRWCGASRPGHFDGVLTVVAKLFNLVTPDKAYFGEKDYQQYLLIKRMVADLHMPLEVVGCPTYREPDGLAMSSRNYNLKKLNRKNAVALSKVLEQVQQAARAGERSTQKLTELAKNSLLKVPRCEIDYLAIVDQETLMPLKRIKKEARMLMAVKFQQKPWVRLIDNGHLVVED
ncbi:MAG: pantoate--beta-alanine ligase [Myxococcales bacterium]|nr:pantoate--beta-alanine ligase [Myxococcales bacterium]|tara:strand:- start:2958 stop:3833 length:876 start_codon:yes stop_codon:yes gene_type:complete